MKCAFVRKLFFSPNKDLLQLGRWGFLLIFYRIVPEIQVFSSPHLPRLAQTYLQRLHAKIAYKDCTQRLHTKIAYKDYIHRLHTKIAYTDCIQRLYTKIAYKDCIQRLHTKIAYKDCLKRLPTKITYKDCIQRLDLPSPAANSLEFRISRRRHLPRLAQTCLAQLPIAAKKWHCLQVACEECCFPRLAKKHCLGSTRRYHMYIRVVCKCITMQSCICNFISM